MADQFLFNSPGRWVAFRVGRNLFDVRGKWMGWFPWEDQDAVDTAGRYLGTVHPGDRFYAKHHPPYRGYPGYAGYPGYPGYPGYMGHSPLPPGAEDVPQLRDT